MIVSVFTKHAGRNKRCLKRARLAFFAVTIFPFRPAVYIFRQTALGASGWSCLDLPGPSLFALGLREVWILRRRSDSCHPCILEERRRSRKSSSQQRTMNTGWIRRMSQRTKEEQTLCLQQSPGTTGCSLCSRNTTGMVFWFQLAPTICGTRRWRASSAG